MTCLVRALNNINKYIYIFDWIMMEQKFSCVGLNHGDTMVQEWPLSRFPIIIGNYAPVLPSVGSDCLQKGKSARGTDD